MRVSANARELVEDLRDRRPLLVGHGLAIGLLALLGGLALLPSRDTAPASSAPALGAYEEAMGRLRDQGEARTREHEAEKRRMEDQVKDSEAMARAGELTSGIVHEVRNGLGDDRGLRAPAREEARPRSRRRRPRRGSSTSVRPWRRWPGASSISSATRR